MKMKKISMLILIIILFSGCSNEYTNAKSDFYRLEYAEITEKTVYSEALKRVFDKQGNITTPLYLGDTF